MSKEKLILEVKRAVEAMKQAEQAMKRMFQPSQQFLEQWKTIEEAAASFQRDMAPLAQAYTEAAKALREAENAVRWIAQLKPDVLPILSIADRAMSARLGELSESFSSLQKALEPPTIDWNLVGRRSVQVDEKLLNYVSLLEQMLERERHEKEILQEAINQYKESRRERAHFYE